RQRSGSKRRAPCAGPGRAGRPSLRHARSPRTDSRRRPRHRRRDPRRARRGRPLGPAGHAGARGFDWRRARSAEPARIGNGNRFAHSWLEGLRTVSRTPTVVGTQEAEGCSGMTGAAPAIRILAVDDHDLLRKGIAALLEVEPDMDLVAEATNGREAI